MMKSPLASASNLDKEALFFVRSDVEAHSFTPKNSQSYGEPQMRIENEHSFRAALGSSINLFLGAGFSILAEGKSGQLPVGGALATELRAEFGVDPTSAMGLPQLSTVISAAQYDKFERYLRSRFTVSRFDSRYCALQSIAVTSIFSTNIDNLVQEIYKNDKTRFLNDIFTHGATPNGRESIDLIQLHGSVNDPSRPLTFTPLDIAAASSSDPDRWSLFRTRLLQTPTLYWGYSMADSGTLQAVRAGSSPSGAAGEAWIQVRDSSDTASIEYFRAIGLQVIEADTNEMLDYLSEFSKSQPDAVVPASLELENVPLPGNSPPRPIEEYFLGYPVAWSDVYSRQLPQTSHFRPIQDLIASGSGAVISGIPGCGKTTLLMQLATQTSFDGPKLIFDSLAESQAELIKRKLSNKKALIFLDNVASDIRSLEILSKEPNIVVVAADRDYNLGSVSNRLRSSGLPIRAASSLTDADVQKIWQAIPVRIRSRARTDPRMEGDLTSSAIEFVMANVESTDLVSKLVDSIHEMRGERGVHHLILLASCYLHSSRSRLSMDVLVPLLGDLVKDYREIYDAIDHLGELTVDVGRGGQDEFVSRSLLVSEQVMLKIRSSVLREFLEAFHLNVSPLRVFRYDSFRRKGFSWRLFARAFHSAIQGAQLYDSIMLHDDSPQIRQQKALFLAEKRDYSSAFSELDVARSARRRVDWSIENSYYNVLFKANLGRSNFDPEAHRQCVNSLDGLIRCFDSDRRKGMHALVFADCAKAFAVEAGEPELSTGYLRTAQRMLEEIVSTEPWMDRPPVLLRQINRTIRNYSGFESEAP